MNLRFKKVLRTVVVVLAVAALPVMSWGQDSEGVAAETPDRVYLRDDVLFLAVTDSNAVWGYSNEVGKWVKSPAKPTEDGEQIRSTLVIVRSVACFREGKMLHAFSGLAGKWGSLETKEDIQPALTAEMVWVEDGSRLSVFSAKTGRWSTLERAD